MRIFPDQLGIQLKNIKPCYLLFGDDPWLVEDCKNQIVSACKNKGYEEKIQLNSQDPNFTWQQVEQEWQSLSLFASQRIIEVQLAQPKPGVEGGAILQNIMSMPNPDTVLLLIGSKLSIDQTKTKWFKTLDLQGLYIPCATPEGNQFSRWLDNRIRYFNLNLGRDAKALLYNLYEGNLLAADQSLKLLQLLNPTNKISAADLSNYFEDQSRFSVFQLADALLTNNQTQVQHMLTQLKADGTAFTILLWAIFKELTTLLSLQTAKNQGENLHALWGKYRIWEKRKPFYIDALNRLDIKQIEAILTMGSKLELSLKQQGYENWMGLSHLCLLFDPLAHHQLMHIDIE